MKAQFPRQMLGLPGVPAHHVVIPAFLNSEVRLYTIDIVLARDLSIQVFRCTRHVVGNSTRTPRVGLAGSGASYLTQSKKNWMRSLLCVTRACDRQNVSELAVADHLANLNNQVQLGVSDKSGNRGKSPGNI
jgi:hypothetical protein